MTIITRVQWGARYGDGKEGATNPATELWLHHSVTLAPDMQLPRDDDYAAIRVIDQIGRDRFGDVYGFPYTFGVTPVGLVFEGHNVRKMGAHTYGHNQQGRAIVLVGNYSQQHPTAEQEHAVADLIVYGHDLGWWTVRQLTGGHRDTKATECPGNYAYARIGAINTIADGLRPVPAPPANRPPRLAWPFPVGHYVGDVKGPAKSHGGFYPAERYFVENVQRWLIFRGCVSNVSASQWQFSGWADGLFQRPYSTNAATEWHRRFYSNQPYPDQIWADDYQRLTG